MRKSLSMLLVLVLYTVLAFAQRKEVTGKVTDASGNPVSGVSVKVRGANTGTSADANGVFKISVAPNSTLIISGVGYETQDVPVGTQTDVSVILKQGSNALSEVVVTALGISRNRKAVNYSTQVVGAESIAAAGKPNLVDDLNGKVSGVQITNAGGQAGSGSTIVIRGYNSLTGNNQPLYVVDGVPIDNTTDESSSQYNTPTANRAIDLNPNDYESVTILKGGAATALYGIAASNGAVVITSKKGRSGKVNIEGGYGYTWSQADKFPELQTAGYMKGSNGLWNNVTSNNWGPIASTNPVFPAGTEIDLTGSGVYTDESGNPIPFYPNNYKNFYVDGNAQRYNLQLSGGGDKTTFLIGASRMTQNGIVPNNTYDKTSVLVNVVSQLTNRLKMDVKVNYLNTGGFRFDQGTMTNGLDYYVNTWNVKTYPWKLPPDQIFPESSQETWWQPTIQTPNWTVNETGENYRVNRYLSALGIEYKIANDWTLNYRVGIDGYSEGRKNVVPMGSNSTSGTSYLGSMYEVRINNQQVNNDLMLNYDHKFNEDLHMHVLVGGNLFYKKYDNLSNYGTSFVLPDLYDVTNTQTQTISHSSYQKKLYGVYGDLSLDYKEFLFLDITARNDWSSTLPRDNDHFLYPSISAGFVFSDLLKADWLSYGKLRASYAGTANDAPVNATSTAYANITPNVFGHVRFSYPTTVNNPNIKPEFTKQSEIGIDLGFFKRKLFLEATYYNKNSYDQIIYAPTSNATGVLYQLINLGETTNKGFDITLTFKDLVNAKGFSWTSAFNFSHNTSDVVKVGDNGNDKVSLVYGYNTTTEIDAQKGQKFGAIYGYSWKRYWDAAQYPNAEAMPNYTSGPYQLDADGNPSQSDGKVLLGNTSPDFILGWNNTITFKNFNFGFTLEWRKGGDVINDYNNLLTYSGNSALTQNRWYSDTYEGANTTKTWVGVDETGKPVSQPIALSKTYYTSNFIATDENFVEDASWFRLRNIYLGYSFPASITKSLHIQGLDITLAGRNVWLSTKYTGIDPEVSSQGSGPNGVVGLDAAGIPSTKSWDASIRIRF